MTDDSGPEATTIDTEDGLALEGEVVWPSDPRALIVLAHPHPLFGGSMRSLVTSELFRQLPARGFATMRFNFRGVEGSEGEHDEGVGERLDIEAAIDHLDADAAERGQGDLTLALAGWSFGADVSLTVDSPRLSGWFLIAPPLRMVHQDRMVAAKDPRPKLLVVPEHDQYRSPDSAREVTADWTNTTVEMISGGDHFLAGKTGQAAERLDAFVAELRA